MSFAMRPPWWMHQRMMMMMAMGSRRRGWGFGPGGGIPPGPFFPGRAKVGRGGVRTAILHLLTEGPMHGYQIIQELSERTHGYWQPSPGAIYPTLQQLDDEGLVRVEEKEGKKVYALTEEGRARVDDQGEAPWEQLCTPFDNELVGLRDLAFQVGAAVLQVVHAGDQTQRARAKEILEDAKRRIYQVLASEATPDE